MKNRTSGYSSDNENTSTKQQDLSILRKPILTSITGFLEAKRAFENGTEEIRRLLSRECDILYECKTCRNVFRSLTNFISHKRVYCRDIYNNSFDINRNGFIDQDISTIIRAEEEYTNYKSNNNHKPSKKNIVSSTNNNNSNNNNNQQTSNNNNNNLDKSNKDLTSIIERLINREQKNRTLRLSDFYEQVDLKLTQEEILKKNHVLQLDGIPSSSVAVYQTVKKEDCDNIKKEIFEINDIINCKSILGPDGKLLDTGNYNYNGEHFLNSTNSTINQIKIAKGIENNSNEKNVICEICKLKFSTEKTLKLHIQTKHILSTYVYQCPSCSQTYLKPSDVIRHLSNDHKKSLRRIRQMRETIFKRRMRIDEVQVKGPSRELARLQGNQVEQVDAENTRDWIDNIDRSPRNSPLCNYCGKKFERRAVLTTHLQTCTAKHQQTPTLISKKLNDLTFSRENSSTSRSSTSSPANNNSATNSNVVNSNANATSSLLAFAAKSIANATFELIKVDESSKLNQNSCNKTIETDKPRSAENSTETVNKRKRRKPETIIIRKSDSVLNSSKEDQNIESVISGLKNTKIDPKNFVKKQKQIADLNTIRENQINGNVETKDILIPETIEKSIAQLKNQEKISNISSTVLKKKDFNRDKFLKLITPRKDLIFYCRICKKAFSALSNLRRHISMFHYRRRKFGCHICPYRAFRKYDVVNHLNSAHSLTGEQNLDQILVAEDNLGKDDVDGDIIISDNGEFKGEKEEDIENIKADIAKANTVKNKIHHVNKDENYIAKSSSSKKGRKPKEPYVIKNMHVPVENSTPLDNVQSSLDVINPAQISTIELDLESVPTEEPTAGKICSEIVINPNEPANPIDKVNNLENSEKDMSKNHEEEDAGDKTPGNIKRSDSILSISSNEDRNSLNTNNTASPTLKRPIRNRVKPVKKDFVYDLSNFLKKDMLCIERESFGFGKSATKRRNIIVNLDDSSRESSSSNSTISSSSSNNINNSINKANSTDEERRKSISKSTVNTISQCSTLENSSTYLNTTADSCMLNTKPVIFSSSTNHLKKEQSTQLSLEVDTKHKILNISNGIDKMSPNFTNLFKSFEDLKKVKHVRRTSDDAVIRLFNKKRKLNDLADLASMSDSSLSTAGGLSNKIETNINGTITENLKPEKTIGNTTVHNLIGGQTNNNKDIIKNVPNEIKPILNLNQNRISEVHQNFEDKYVIKCPSDKEFQEYLMKNDLSEPVKKINLAAVLEQQENDSLKNESVLHQQNSLLVSGKRITLLQRLADNKNKKIQDSFLRNALEN